MDLRPSHILGRLEDTAIVTDTVLSACLMVNLIAKRTHSDGKK